MRKKLIRISIIASLLIHFVLVGSSYFVWIPGVSMLSDKARRIFHLSNEGAGRQRGSAQASVESYVNTAKFDRPQSPNESALIADVKKTAIDTPQIQTPGADNKLPMDAPKASHRGIRESQELLKGQGGTPARKVISDKGRLPNLFAPEESSSVSQGASDIEIPAEFEESMAGFTPGAVSQTVLNAIQASEPQSRRGTVGGDPDALDRFMMVKLYTWKDPKDGQGYFKIAIYPGKDAQKLKSHAKEIVFLMDASLSIRKERLGEFINGISYCIKNLNPGDRFNIITFKDTSTRFKPASVESDKNLGQEAVRFLNALEPSERTDIYSAFLKSTEEEPVHLPSYIVFLSDGRPTFGVDSSREIISEITRKNALRRSVFAYTGGVKVNRYLLDFLAYQNRGWAEFAPRINQIDQKLRDFYDKIRYPILINLKYQFSQLDAGEVYPRRLPDFFRNAEFVVYGLYRDEKDFSMRITGEIDGDKKEFIFADDLTQAEAGSEEIARHWAFNKIYHLIGEMTLKGKNDAMLKEVDSLSKKFGIITPYDLEA